MANARRRLYVDPNWNSEFFLNSDSSDSDSCGPELSSSTFKDLAISSDSTNKKAHVSAIDVPKCSRYSISCIVLPRETVMSTIMQLNSENQLKAGALFARKFSMTEGTGPRTSTATILWNASDSSPGAKGRKKKTSLIYLLWRSPSLIIEGYEPREYPFERWKFAGIGCETSELGFNVTVHCMLTEGSRFAPPVTDDMLILLSSPAAALVERRSTVTDVGSKAVMLQARKWLNDCRHGHPDCRQHLVPKLPKRVIDVGKSGDFNSSRLYVSELDESAEYAALSYCWGGPQVFTTNTANLESNIDNLSLAKLPETIRDAVLVTQNIGIRYLWVDAFCILQDSDEDKATEITAMGEIYNGATITISAACTRGVNDGILWPRTSQMKKTYQFPFLSLLPALIHARRRFMSL